MKHQLSSQKKLSIHPYQVAKAWRLCPHLTIAIGCLWNVTRQVAIIENLKEAEYLIELELKCTDDREQSCQSHAPKQHFLDLEAVLYDWQLSFHLREALSNIKAYQQIPDNIDKLRLLKEEVLHQALAHIKVELIILSNEVNNKIGL